MPSLGNDLASIREELGKSIEDIHQSTKIPLRILQSIEEDSIFTSLEENTTYIRSYIRSYAKALKIDDDDIVRALDQLESGRYTGFLLTGEDAASKKAFAHDPEDEPAEKDPEKKKEEKAKEKKKDTAPKSETDSDMVHDHAPAGDAGYEDSARHQRIPDPPSVTSVDWADMGRKFTPLQTKSRMWIGFVFIFLIIAGTVGFFIYQYQFQGEGQGPSGQSQNSQEAIPSDSLHLNLSTPASNPNDAAGQAEQAAEALSDTLTLVIYAAYGKLEPVRVYTDVMDSLNPYWIEQGEAFTFDFVNNMRLRGQYSRMVLMLNGHVIENFRQNFYNPETGMLVIERSYFENDDRWLQPPPDSLQIDAPPPRLIRERPIFN